MYFYPPQSEEEATAPSETSTIAPAAKEPAKTQTSSTNSNAATPQEPSETKAETCPFGKSSTRDCTRKKGEVFYEEYGNAMHKLRYENELSPTEWHTLLLAHRILIPWTAEEYCSLVKRLATPPEHNGDANNQDGAPPPKPPASNFLIKGAASATFQAQEHNNTTFLALTTPVFFWRYKDRFLYTMKLAFQLVNDDTHIDLDFTTINYVMNDYLTLRAGKFILPLGFWREKMIQSWINYLPNAPLPYSLPGGPIMPPADLGVDVRGAVPLTRCHSPSKPAMVLTYDFWVGNGPDEKDGNIHFGTNYNDNNNNKAFGGRVSFRPWPFREIGISGMRGQWNNNHHGGHVSSKKDLYYNALVFEWDWRFWQYFRFLGEYMWTKRDAVINPKADIFSDEIFERGVWAQGCLDMGLTHTAILENFELIARYGNVDSDIHKRKCGQWSFGIDYYIDNKMLVKASYDLNHGNDSSTRNNTFWLQWAYGY
ncbi:MAG: hypothetical protein JSR39_05235 [Verrucomicrobia bacterium]|nr:hypothetical protein [Verrucomicrobiota bacterium]